MSMRTRVVAMASAVLLGAGGLALAPAASAAPPYHGIDGGGSVLDDWQDEENLGVDDYTNSNATALWQTVLWADGAQWQDDDGDSHPFEKAQIDGVFGDQTESATQWWQEHFNLTDRDGVVTEESWTFAQGKLSGPPGNGTVTYNGVRKATFKRVGVKYRVRFKGTGSWKNAYYDKLG
ncbi:peptidoglycan-binding domain-containing protein [Streptomyces hyaluromycini]|uniref:Peptidoglycan-binding domain-containing protein n=1 Tax=Streptomyces hyaluromycini TaxID=1377993 RepID=A0ABV1WPR8_9ACTN